MLLIVLESSFFAGIGIAVLAAVDAGIVFANVFALDASTELALSFVLITALTTAYGIFAIGENDCVL